MIYGLRPRNGTEVSGIDRFALDDFAGPRLGRSSDPAILDLDGSRPQAHHPPRRRPVGRRAARHGARLHELHAPPRRPRRRASCSPAPTPGETYQLTGKVADGTWKHEGTVNVFRVRDRNGHARCPSATTARCRTRSARAARSSSRSASRATRSSARRTRWSPSARRSSPTEAPHDLSLVLTAGKFLLDPGAGRRVYGAGASLYGRAHAATARWSTPAAARSTRWRVLPGRRLRAPRGRVPALGLLVRARRDALLDDDADLLPRHGDLVLPGGLAAAVGDAAVAVVVASCSS